MRAAAVEFAQAYDADVVMDEHWKPALEKLLGNRLPALREIPSNGMNRQARRKLQKAKR